MLDLHRLAVRNDDFCLETQQRTEAQNSDHITLLNLLDVRSPLSANKYKWGRSQLIGPGPQWTIAPGIIIYLFTLIVIKIPSFPISFLNDFPKSLYTFKL